MSTIGYHCLTESEKRLYERFEEAFRCYKSEVNTIGIDAGVNVSKVCMIAQGDHPEAVYFNKNRYTHRAIPFLGTQIFLADALPPRQAEKMTNDVIQAAKQAAQEIALLNPLTLYDTLLCIYEYIQDHVCYDMQEMESCCRTGQSLHPQSHNAYGALIHGTGVCDGIAAAFALIAAQMGLECSVLSGEATFQTTTYAPHAWNILKNGDRFYHLDVMWDTNVKEQSGEYFYDYFCVTDGEIGVDHRWDVTTVPPCEATDLSFYRRSGCLANNLSHLDRIFERYVKSKQPVVRVRIADGIAIPEPADTFLMQRLREAAQAAGRYGGLRYSFNQNSRCFYAVFQ